MSGWIERHPNLVTVLLVLTFPVWAVPVLLWMTAQIMYWSWTE